MLGKNAALVQHSETAALLATGFLKHLHLVKHMFV
jgi:hypothetical protein